MRGLEAEYQLDSVEISAHASLLFEYLIRQFYISLVLNPSPVRVTQVNSKLQLKIHS